MMKRIGLWLILLVVLSNVAHAQQRYHDGIDDVLQYTPYAAVFALKACGVDSRDDWKALALTSAASFVASAGIGYVMKQSIKEWRPDCSDQKSMPSGHTIVAFAGATMLRHEFGHVSPWITVAGYSVATFTAVDRMIKERHHWYDVLAGAGIGVAATEFTWWLSRKVFRPKKERLLVGFSGQNVEVIWKM